MAETQAHLTTFSISLLLFFFFYSATSTVALAQEAEVLRSAIEALSGTGFSTMGAALEHLSQILPISQSSPLTVFAPPNSAFRLHPGQPYRELLRYHLCHLKFRFESLGTLPYGTKIPTYSAENSLIVTTLHPPQPISLNGVLISPIPLFDSGPIVIYTIRDFFDPSFKLPRSPVPHQLSFSDLKCAQHSFLAGLPTTRDAVYVNGYTIMTGFLALQLVKFPNRTLLTVFAPPDSQINDELMNFRNFSAFFHRHVVGSTLTRRDLWMRVKDKIPLPTSLWGFTIKVASLHNQLTVNGVPIKHQDFFTSHGVVVHGIPEMLKPRNISAEFRSSVEEYTRIHGDVFFGRLQDILDCAASRASQQRNGSTSIMASNICVDLRGVDSLIFEGSFVDDIRPPQMNLPSNFQAPTPDYRSASKAMKAIGDSFMSSFLDMQLIQMGLEAKLTVVAPFDDDNDDVSWEYYYHMYLQHVIPCRITWSDLVKLEEGTTLPTLDKDEDPLTIVVTKYGDTLLMNDVPVTYPDLYSSDTLVIHGVASKLEDLKYKPLELDDPYATEEEE